MKTFLRKFYNISLYFASLLGPVVCIAGLECLEIVSEEYMDKFVWAWFIILVFVTLFYMVFDFLVDKLWSVVKKLIRR